MTELFIYNLLTYAYTWNILTLITLEYLSNILYFSIKINWKSLFREYLLSIVPFTFYLKNLPASWEKKMEFPGKDQSF